jgi:hypothetical protein
MRRWLGTILVALTLLSAPLVARGAVSGSDQAAIHSVITNQIEAFRQDNAAGAFGYATPNLQAQFGSPDRFMSMVRHGYLPVYRPRTVEFGLLSDEDGEVVQLVELIGPDGVAYTARYTMERQADGSWRISGCALLQSQRVGT